MNMLDRSCMTQYVCVMNKLSPAQRAQIITLLVEGTSLRAITRITGASINTVTKLLIDAGKACSKYQDRHPA